MNTLTPLRYNLFIVRCTDEAFPGIGKEENTIIPFGNSFVWRGVPLSLEFSDSDGTGGTGTAGNLSEINISDMLPVTDEYVFNVFNKNMEIQ